MDEYVLNLFLFYMNKYGFASIDLISRMQNHFSCHNCKVKFPDEWDLLNEYDIYRDDFCGCDNFYLGNRYKYKVSQNWIAERLNCFAIDLNGLYLQSQFDYNYFCKVSVINPKVAGKRNTELIMGEIKMMYGFHVIPNHAHYDKSKMIKKINGFCSNNSDKQWSSLFENDFMSLMNLGDDIHIEYKDGSYICY